MARRHRSTDFARALAEALGLPTTAKRIIGALASARERLGVDEIVRRVRSSERSVRENLRLLLQRGLLHREVFVTANKKLAYAYSLRPVEDLLATARKEFAHALDRIERVVRRFRGSVA
jgi:predicted DNA-binding transcriptional regulator